MLFQESLTLCQKMTNEKSIKSLKLKKELFEVAADKIEKLTNLIKVSNIDERKVHEDVKNLRKKMYEAMIEQEKYLSSSSVDESVKRC